MLKLPDSLRGIAPDFRGYGDTYVGDTVERFIADAGHFTYIQKPDEFTELLVAHLQRAS